MRFFCESLNMDVTVKKLACFYSRFSPGIPPFHRKTHRPHSADWFGFITTEQCHLVTLSYFKESTYCITVYNKSVDSLSKSIIRDEKLLWSHNKWKKTAQTQQVIQRYLSTTAVTNELVPPHCLTLGTRSQDWCRPALSLFWAAVTCVKFDVIFQRSDVEGPGLCKTGRDMLHSKRSDVTPKWVTSLILDLTRFDITKASNF